MPALTAAPRPPARAVAVRHRPLTAFLAVLFEQLDAHEVRYCVLHGYESLPESASSDIDMAVHPADLPRLAPVLAALRRSGFAPVQQIEYDIHGYYLVFAWLDGAAFRTIAIDVTTEHRQGHFILQPGAMLVEGRRRRGAFWTPSATAEFAYLLSKKVVKAAAGAHQATRLRELVQELGDARAGEIAAELFGDEWQARVVAACRDGALPGLLPALRAPFVRALLGRDPLNVVRYHLSDLPRKVRRARRPAGVFVTVLGPDGVGKSTLIAALESQLAGAFRQTARFHWRPMWLAGAPSGAPAGGPHGRTPHGVLRSVVRSAVHLLDYVVGFQLRVRPVLVRSALVIFDRYAGDMRVDPARYRYGGPRWLLRFVEALAPEPDLQLVLDAPAELVAARKQEVALDELRRQRHAFLDLAARAPEAVVLDAALPASEVARDAAQAVVERMARRFESRHPEWSASRSTPTPARGPLEPWLTLEPAAAGPQQGQRSIALPSAEQLRWLVPSAGLGTTRRALAVYTPYNPAAHLLKTATEWTLGLAPFAVLPSRLRQDARVSPAVHTLVARVLGEQNPLFSVVVGAAGAYRKATVQVQRADGTTVAYLKLPFTDAAATRVRHEADVLAQLQQHEALASCVPEVLYAGPCDTSYALMVSPVSGRRGAARFSSQHAAFLGALADVARVDRPGVDVVDDVAAQWERVAGQVPGEVRAVTQRALDDARRALHGVPLPCGLGHGDFAPWNTRAREDRLVVFDWDRAEFDVPLWWDLFHFEAQVGSLLGRQARSGFRCDAHPGSHAAFVLYLVRSMADALFEDPDQPRGLEFRSRVLARYQSAETWAQAVLPC